MTRGRQLATGIVMAALAVATASAGAPKYSFPILNKAGKNTGKVTSIFANGGTALVIHEKADDEISDPSGNSGNRIACAIIKQ